MTWLHSSAAPFLIWQARCFGGCVAFLADRRRQAELARQSALRLLKRHHVLTWEAWRAYVAAVAVATEPSTPLTRSLPSQTTTFPQ